MGFFTPMTRKCPEIGVDVRVNQSEGQCRAQHGCEQYLCPLKTEFEAESVDFRVQAARMMRP